MMFKRRKERSIPTKVRHAVWPDSGWRRALHYAAKRAMRLRASPHAIAMGMAAGTMASFTPFMGLHAAIAVAVAWVFGGSIIAALLGTLIGNPLTFPLIWAVTYRIGTWMLGTPQGSDPELSLSIWQRSFDAIWPLIKPMTIGGLPLGILAALAVYFPIRYIVAEYQRKRAERRAEAERRRAQGDLA